MFAIINEVTGNYLRNPIPPYDILTFLTQENARMYIKEMNRGSYVAVELD